MHCFSPTALGFVWCIAKQLAGTGPVRWRHVFEDDVNVLGRSNRVFHNTLGNISSNSGFLRVLFPFKPASSYDGHGRSSFTMDRNEEGIDLMIRFGELKDVGGLVARRLARQRWAICAAPSYLERYGTPQQLEDLVHHHCIVGHRRGQPLSWRAQQHSQTVRFAPPVTHQIGDGEVMILAAVAGAGLCQMPRCLFTDDINAGLLVEVLGAYEPEPVEVHAVWPKVSHLRPKVRYVVDELVQLFERWR